MYYSVHINRLDLKDEYTNLGHVFQTYEFFVIKRGPVRPYDYNDDVQLAITYELDRDLSIIRRKVYRFLDLLSDIGGLAGTLFALFSVLIVIF